MIGLFGGAFNPPHYGHLAVVRGAFDAFPLSELQVLVSGDPAHKQVDCPVDVRVSLAARAFAEVPWTTVRADPYRYTVDLLRAERPHDAIFLVGADQYRDFGSWKEPDEVLELARLGVATRSGIERPPLTSGHEGRVVFFEIDSPPISSRDLRERLRRGESIDGKVAPAVLEEITRRGLYRSPGYTGSAPDAGDRTD